MWPSHENVSYSSHLLILYFFNFRIEIKTVIIFLSPFNTENKEQGRKDGYEETRTEKMNTQLN